MELTNITLFLSLYITIITAESSTEKESKLKTLLLPQDPTFDTLTSTNTELDKKQIEIPDLKRSVTPEDLTNLEEAPVKESPTLEDISNTEVLKPVKESTTPEDLLKSKVTKPVKRSAIIDSNIPIAILRNGVIANKILVQKPEELTVQKRVPLVLVQKQNGVGVPKDIVRKLNSVPTELIIQNSKDFVVPKKVFVQNADTIAKPAKFVVKKPRLANNIVSSDIPTVNRKIALQKSKEIPVLNGLLLNSNAVLDNDVLPTRILQTSNDVLKTRSPKSVLLKESRLRNAVPQVQIGKANPYLPAASPVSPLTSSNVPQSRGQFLRKIPIPPPSV